MPGMVPVGIDTERGDIDTLLVHRFEARRNIGHQQFRLLARLAENRQRLGYRAMGVYIDRLDPCTVDDDFAALGMIMGCRIAGLDAIARGRA